MYRSILHGTREVPLLASPCRRGPRGQKKESTITMDDSGNSDNLIVLEKCANKGFGGPKPAECMEERGLAKGNSGEQTRFWTQGQYDLHHALDRIRQVARENRPLARPIKRTPKRHYPRQEPGAVIPLAGI
jgi:hypothetical protein